MNRNPAETARIWLAMPVVALVDIYSRFVGRGEIEDDTEEES